MDLLVYLAQRPGKVVSKDEILEAVWAKEFVSEGTLTHAVAVIRQTLGDDVRHPTYIETIPTRGYRLIARVGPPEGEGNGGASAGQAAANRVAAGGRPRVRRTALLVAALVALALVALVAYRFLGGGRVAPAAVGIRIVVLPFQNLGPAVRDYVAQGITDDITTRLAAAHGVGVISRTTAAYCAKTAQSAPQIAQELGINYILEGTVRWEPDRPEGTELRVNAQLIRAAKDTLVWGESYRVEPAGLVDVGATIAGRVVRELGVPVGGSEQTRLAARPTTNSDAYQAYLCGMRYHDLDSREQLGLAAAMFERAVSLDPSFALAYAELSLVHSRVYGLGIDTSPECRADAERAAARALAVRPDLPEAHLALGAVDDLVKGDFEDALAQYHIAARDLPNEAAIPVLIAEVHRKQGKWAEARAELEDAVVRDPASFGAFLALGDTLAQLRDFAGADRAYQRAGNISPDRIEPYVGRFWNYLSWDGTPDRAARVLEGCPLRDQAVVAYCRSYLAFVRRDFRGAVGALEGAGELSSARSFGFLPGKLLECVYLDAGGDRAAAAKACAAVLPSRERGATESPTEPRRGLDAALALALLGRRAEAIGEADRAAASCSAAPDGGDDSSCLLEQAEVLTRCGESAKAVGILARLLSVPGPVTAGWLRLDPRWDRLRGDVGFKALVAVAPSER
jgi:TolB-like protein